MQNGKIIVIDDEEKVRKLLTLQLQQAGYEIQVFSEARKGINALTDGEVDCVICDIRMPGVSGLEVLQYVQNYLPDVPVIMLTGVVDVEMTVSFMRQGAFDFLIKPIKRNELLLTIERAFNQRALILDKKRLERENIEYQRNLETKVEDRTIALRKALVNLEKIHLDTVKILASAIEEKEPYLRGHSNRVRLLSSRISVVYGLSTEQVKRLEFGALLHDIGKIAIPEAILTKPARLTDEEYDIIKQHPVIGARIAQQVDYFQDVLPIIRYHHERIDGKGYPDGLYGEQIPVVARIISVADTFDAMTSDRPYRTPFSNEKACGILLEERGHQFDKDMVDIFVENRLYDDDWNKKKK